MSSSLSVDLLGKSLFFSFNSIDILFSVDSLYCPAEHFILSSFTNFLFYTGCFEKSEMEEQNNGYKFPEALKLTWAHFFYFVLRFM